MAVEDWQSSNTSTAVIPAFTETSANPVSGVGFGCVLIDIAKARTLEKPFFSPQIFIESGAHRVRLCNEDYRFCERITGAGYRVRLAGGVRCGHYDRSTDTVIPRVWEPNELTSVRRMIVSEDGLEKLVHFNPRVAVAPERHEMTIVEYLFSGEN